MNYTIKQIQQKLNELNFDAGPADGVRGKKTINAIRAFQRAAGIRSDGIAGPQTLTLLFGRPVQAAQSPDNWPWLTEAMRVLGWHESTDNKALRHWLRSDGVTLGDPKKLPWCGDFVETCILRSLPDEPVPDNPYYARNWAKFGINIKPQVGAILVFQRPGGGHVGFYVGETKTHFIVLGGNQNNRVSKSKISKGRLIASRWPATVSVNPTNGAMELDDSDISETTNEE